LVAIVVRELDVRALQLKNGNVADLGSEEHVRAPLPLPSLAAIGVEVMVTKPHGELELVGYLNAVSRK
jgi:hypothetical protein